MTHDQLTALGLALVLEQHLTPAEAALRLLEDHWSALDLKARRALCVLGLQRQVALALCEHRAAHPPPPPGPPPEGTIARANWDREEQHKAHEAQQKVREDIYWATHSREDYRRDVNAIHSRIQCWRRMCDQYRYREQCVGQVVFYEPEEKERWIAEALARNEEFNERTDRLTRETWDGIGQIIETYAAERARKMLASITLMAADGTMKPLLSFSAVDLTKWNDEAGVRAASWTERQAWFAEAGAALERAKVERIHELPAEIIAHLAQSAEAIWKKGKGAEEDAEQ